jgi:hypothetical protein
MIAPYKHNTTSLAGAENGAEKHLLMSLMKEGGVGGVRERDENASGSSNKVPKIVVQIT